MSVKTITELIRESDDFKKCIEKENDFSVAVIGAALLDSFIASLLGQFFISGSTSEQVLFNPGKSWEMMLKAKVAYLNGLLSKPSFHNATAVCEIRNLFAHSHLLARFDDERIAKACDAKLDLSGTVAVHYEGPHAHKRANVESLWKSAKNRRGRFVTAVSVTLRRIIATSQTVQRRESLTD